MEGKAITARHIRDLKDNLSKSKNEVQAWSRLIAALRGKQIDKILNIPYEDFLKIKNALAIEIEEIEAGTDPSIALEHAIGLLKEAKHEPSSLDSVKEKLGEAIKVLEDLYWKWEERQ